MTTENRIHVHENPSAAALADELFQLVDARTDWNRPQTWLLSGGRSPGVFFDRVVASGRDLSKLTLFPTDERLVPKTDDRSNYHLLVEHFLKTDLPATHRPTIGVFYDTQLDRAENNRLLRRQIDHLPPVTFALMGIGTDAHTASLFPHKPQNELPDDWIYATYEAGDGLERISFGREFFQRAEYMAFFCPGAEKVETLERVLKGSYDPAAYPVQWFFRNFGGPMDLFCR